MAYYFMVSGKNKQQIALNISNSKYFTRISRFQNEKYSLEEIDNFTMMFDNETEMRKALIDENILPIELANKEITTRILKKGEYNKIMYDLFYQKDIKYIGNPNLLIARIEEKLNNGDYLFVKKFAHFFTNYYVVSSTAPEVRYFAEESLRTGKRSIHFDREIDKNGDKPLTRMCKLLIFDHYQNFNGTIGTIRYDETAVNYVNLHKVLAFVNHYDKKRQLQEEKTKKSRIKKYSQIELNDELKQPKEHKEIETNTINEEQIQEEKTYELYQDNLFDLIAGNRLEQYVNGEFEVISFPSPKKRVLKPAKKEYGTQINLFDTNK